MTRITLDTIGDRGTEPSSRGRRISSSGPRRGAPAERVPRAFLLSPAHCDGKRARLLMRAEASFDLARRLRDGGAPLGEVFSHLSGLYFRGKLAYSLAFATAARGIMIITPTDGLVPPETVVTVDDLRRYASVAIAAGDERYRQPLTHDCERLLARVGRQAEVVLLGSLATRKYLDVLEPMFGPRLRLPREFVGRGDMSRGALLLRAVREGRELEYMPVPSAIPPRHRR